MGFRQSTPHLRFKLMADIYNSMTGEQVNARKLLSSWTLHFEAKKTHEL